MLFPYVKTETEAAAMTEWRLKEDQRQKYEQAERFGLMETLKERGWGGLSARDAGRIGGAMHGKCAKKNGNNG